MNLFTKIAKTAEQASKYGRWLPLQKPARSKGIAAAKIAKTVEHAETVTFRPFPFLLLLIFVLSSVIPAQEKPSAIKVDEFGKITCEDLLARADNFFMQMNANPSARGYCVIRGSNDLLRRKLGWEAEFKAALAVRMSDSSRLAVVRGPETGDFNVQFWIAPQGADVPDFKPTIWRFSLPSGTKPFLINTSLRRCAERP
jgi:hypothetical protein